MLSTTNISQSPASLHQNGQLESEFGNGEHVDVDKICPGCKFTAVTDDGGLVVAFGQSFFHVDCFKCAKCGNKVTADTNLLLLSDGSPVCANCSYNCNVCKLPILDEAIMTGDDSYHAHCFKCKVCHNRIDELVFAKTSQGIYCMDCHNERMIKIRRHAQKKAEREKAAAAGGSSSSRETRLKRDNGISPHFDTPGSTKTYHTSSSQSTPRPKDTSSSRRRSQPYVDDAFSPPAGPGSAKNSPSYLTPLFPPPQLNVAPPASPTTPRTVAHQISSPSDSNGALSAPTSAREKRRSINPGLILNHNSLRSPVGLPTGSRSPTLSPMSATFIRQQGNRSPTPPTYNDRASPLRDYFPDTKQSRPLSNESNDSPRDNGAESGDTPQQRSISNRSPDDLSTSTRSRKVSSPTISISAFSGVHDEQLNSGSVHPRRSFGERPFTRQRGSSSSSMRERSGSASRGPSRADVPHSVESSTDTEPEPDECFDGRQESSSMAPALPPKSAKPQPPPNSRSNAVSLTSETECDSITASALLDSGSDNDESTPVEQTSHSTFIAPALPPIRFSLNTADFSDLLNSVGGINALKNLDPAQLARVTEKKEDGVPPTPPPSATAIHTNGVTTPASDVTVFPPSDSRNGDAIRDSSSLGDSRRSLEGTESSHSTLFDQSNKVTLTPPDTSVASFVSPDNHDFVLLRLEEALTDSRDRGAQQLKLDRGFVEAIVKSMQSRKGDLLELKGKFDGAKRASKQYIEGLTVAQDEYDKELKARRDAEAEVTRLRVLLSGQAARITALSGDSRKQELRQQLTKDLHDKLSGLEQDLSKLTVDRDMALAEVEEISATKGNTLVNGERPAALSRSLTVRLDTLKSQYQHDLVPLSREREALSREIAELKAVRDVFLEETTVLNARNEELAQLSTQYARRIDSLPQSTSRPETPARKPEMASRSSEDRLRGPPQQAIHTIQNATSTTSLTDDTQEFRPNPKFSKSEVELPTPSKGKFIKWPGSRTKETPTAADNRSKGTLEHNFQQLSVLRFTRCDHCGDKMWGSQLRCTGCNISVHVRCINHVQVACSHQSAPRDDSQPPPPSMFGRDLVEQVFSDAPDGSRTVPVIVDKCIEAVDAIALDYEGIYRKTGGSGQSKTITQLFERGDYDAFDLTDSDRFNDICSVTSVLKTYFRSLPVPLFTFDLHDHFMAAVEIRDLPTKNKTLAELVNKLPREHYHTVRELMMHLNRICQRSDHNLMNARNLGVVFGPTLMRSRNPGAEFSDMAGKALSIEWLVENAPQVFEQQQ